MPHSAPLAYPVSTREWPSLPLYLDWEEHVAICTLCRYAIPTEGIQASNHFRKKHQISKNRRTGLDQYLQGHQFKSGRLAKPRPTGSQSHPALQVSGGFQCLQCLYISTSVHLVCRHLRGTHTQDDPTGCVDLDMLYKPVLVQSWTQSTTTQSFWTILSAPLKGTTESGANEPQLCTANMKLLHNLRKREEKFHTVQKPQNSSQYSGQDTYENSPMAGEDAVDRDISKCSPVLFVHLLGTTAEQLLSRSPQER
ncbi:hypothetical protein PENSUB_4290 [Penicillium subrubescens]|uniref:C2H2-type domain-containing protein n=1 Tax=Penicillium subrubescens TaxID=1316194 RepID=A0A1Q5UCV2_9EURO|nr:hypothetical protein PENSUB_4290 [Penicillium subrubescens]